MRRVWRALPTLLKVGVAEMVAYRTEFLIWVLTSTMPLIMLALMLAVARDAPIQGYGSEDLVAYYLVTLLVRQLTGSWVVWEMTYDIRQGSMGLKLLRPISPLVIYAVESLAAIPMRGIVALPMTVALLYFAGASEVALAPLPIVLVLAATAAAWLISFLLSAVIGTLAYFVDSAISIHNVYYGVFMVLSGYLLPLAMFPPWLSAANAFLPFAYQLSVPVEIATGRLAGTAALHAVGEAWLWVILLGGLLTLGWRAGLRRYVAFGG
ncbi:MAG: ABC-2 family transporter protein [Myxococcota bacterium]